VFIGHRTGENVSIGGYGCNVYIGRLAGLWSTEGAYNVFIGNRAGNDVTTGADNVLVGSLAGYNITTGNRNTIIGKYNQFTSLTVGNGNVFIGHFAGHGEFGSNKLYIENSDSNLPLIYGEFDNDFVRINGDIDVVGNLTVSGSYSVGLKNVVEDISPQLGGDLDINDHNVDFGNVLTTSGTYKGNIMTVTIDDASTSFGAPLYSAGDFHYERANAISESTMPCLAIALESGSGAKKVLTEGQIFKSGWGWSNGFIYVDVIDGGLRQGDPSISGTSLRQKIGWALNSSTMYFKPSFEMTEITISAGWLGTWAKRRKITVNALYVDQDLSHYPLPVQLGSSAGSNKDDVTDIFDEVGANNKRIAITKDDEITQLYVEIEKWDSTSNSGVLWISKSDWAIASGTDTILYLYYDNNQSDNTDYVGNIGDTAAQNVWDNNFMGVWHLDNSLKDSTSSGIDGTNSNTVNSENGKWGKCRKYDANSDYIEVDNLITGLADATTGTISAWGKISTNPGWNDHVVGMAISRDVDATLCQIIIDWNTSADRLEVHCYLDGWKWYLSSSTDCLDPYWDTWTLITIIHDGVEPAAYINDSIFDTSFADSTDKTCWWKDAITDAASPAHRATIGNYRRSTGAPIGWDDLMDEVRVSTIVRSSAWIKLDYSTGLDNVLTYGSVESY
jgi:hypothetical protein